MLLAAVAIGVRWWATSALIGDLVGHHSSQPHPHRRPRRGRPGDQTPATSLTPSSPAAAGPRKGST